MTSSDTHRTLSRREFCKISIAGGAALLLAGCATPTLTEPSPTAVSQPTATPTATATSTTAPTSTAAVEQLPITRQVVSEFAGVLEKSGIPIDVDTLLDGLKTGLFTGKDGTQFQIASVPATDPALGSLAGEFPLLIQAEEGWRQAHPKDFGSIATMYGSPYYPVEAREAIYATTRANYNIALIDRMAWHETGGENENDWSLLDRSINEVKDALKNGMKIWGVNLLDPLSDFTHTFLKDLKGASRQEMTRIVTDHLTRIASTFKGQVDYYCVITEPREGDNFWNTMGPDYLKTIFGAIRATDPRPKLILNDGRNMMSPGLNMTDYGENTLFDQKMVNLLEADRLVDGMGIQMHLYADQPLDTADFQKTIASYGLPVYITEMDVDMRKAPGNMILQAQMYYQGIQAFLTSPAGSGVMCMWDGAAGDRYSWYERDGSPDSDPTPFNDDLSPKLAYYSIMKAMRDSYSA